MIAFGSKAQDEALSTLVAEVDKVVTTLGFVRDRFGHWKRQVGWKTEEIDLVVKGGSLKCVLPSFRVLLPLTKPSPSGETHQHIAQTNVARILRPDDGPDFDVKVPSMSFGKGRFVQTVVTDISNAMSWFEQFSSPQTCKTNLAKFLKPGCPAYVDVEKYLNGIGTGEQGK
jgi:hypothetical protein